MPFKTIPAVWPFLPTSTRLFLFVLTITAIWFLLSVTHILIRLQSLKGSSPSVTDTDLSKEYAALENRAIRLRQVFVAAGCLFGFVHFRGMEYAYMQIGLSSVPYGFLVIHDMYPHFVVAANVFLVFLGLHCLQWLASARVRAARARLNS